MSDLPQKKKNFQEYFSHLLQKMFLQIISVGLWTDKEKFANEPSAPSGWCSSPVSVA